MGRSWNLVEVGPFLGGYKYSEHPPGNQNCVVIVESHDVGGCFVSVCACFQPSTIRASLLKCVQQRHFGSDAQC